MTELSRATVIIPGVTPDTGARGTDGDVDDLDEAPQGNATEPEHPKSVLQGLRALAGARRGGGGGGGPGNRRTGDRSGRLDLRNSWQILAGSVLVPLGVVFILIAWYGAAHTAYVQQQIPYLVSGSFAGVGCLVLGGLLYWAHWLYRIYDQADLHHEEQLRVLEQTLRAISERAGHVDPGGPSPAPASSALPGVLGATYPPAPPGGRPSPPSYVVTQSGSVYHLPTCPVVAHHPEGLRALAPARTAGFEPCRICLPGTG